MVKKGRSAAGAVISEVYTNLKMPLMALTRLSLGGTLSACTDVSSMPLAGTSIVTLCSVSQSGRSCPPFMLSPVLYSQWLLSNGQSPAPRSSSRPSWR